MKKRTGAVCAGLLVLGMAGSAQATLIDRGNGMLYDSDQGLTWLQDANYASTSGYDSDGRMSWDAAVVWAAGLVYEGHDDWRLPTMTDIGDDGCNFGYSGTDCGYNTDTSLSEFAYMFHDILGNESWSNADGSRNAAGCPGSSPYCVQSTSADGVDVLNLQSDAYWLGTEYAPITDHAWHFFTDDGVQEFDDKIDVFYAWAIRSGDVGAVPEPAMLLLFGAGLAGLGVSRRQKKRRHLAL